MARRSKLAPQEEPKGVTPGRVQSAKKTDDKVWNLSDWPGKGSGVVINIMGKNVLPGSAIRVHLSRLEGSKRLKAMLEEGTLYRGAKPPQGYLKAKNRLKAKIPSSHHRSHGKNLQPATQPPKEPKPVTEVVKEKVVVKEEVVAKVTQPPTPPPEKKTPLKPPAKPRRGKTK